MPIVLAASRFWCYAGCTTGSRCTAHPLCCWDTSPTRNWRTADTWTADPCDDLLALKIVMQYSMLTLSWNEVQVTLPVQNFPWLTDVGIMLLIYEGIDWLRPRACEEVLLILRSIKDLLVSKWGFFDSLLPFIVNLWRDDNLLAHFILFITQYRGI
jgi:hypothetical protein